MDGDGIEVDGQAMDLLVILFRRCREVGLVIPEEVRLDTPGRQRAMCLALGTVLHTYYLAQSEFPENND